ncbi:hypothetical protein P8C59_005233 [Phyllachora maydis]|uniref:Uncharacterized protein n=1 Tax=Phyllachora maydis TaxID=1825666 RepID=A0AAD9I409_9PEZI|nr:hypothetical protein P8C59_005233 [Phyllachora maydis]
MDTSVEDSVSAIKNISSILASLTNSSNAVAATTGKTSYTVEEEEEESDSSFNSSSSSDSNTQLAQLLALKGYKKHLPCVLREPVIEGNKVEEAISSPTLKEPNIVLKTSTVQFIEDNTVLSQPTINGALEGELVDLDLDLEGAVSPDPSNLNTEKPISIEIGPSKLEPYESSSDSKLDKPSLDKPINPVIVESTRPTISIRKPKLPEVFPKTIEPIFAPKPIEVIAPNQPITNEPLDNSDLISEGDKMQLDYYKLLAKTSSYILSFVYKARKRVISKDSTPTTYKQVLKLPRDERSKWLEAITKEFIQLLELGVLKFLPRSLLPSNYKLITC